MSGTMKLAELTVMTDTSPLAILLHIPLLAEDKNVPYVRHLGRLGPS